ncbi:MAG TPA: HAD family hydrolase [Steroidobacteraceae bacterium]|nr:HAD family hydrolase [Steroidobacteraceae bacterium]
MNGTSLFSIRPISSEQLLDQLHGLTRIAFDLDGTLYDTRDFEHPALGAVVDWLKQRSEESLDGLLTELQARRDTDRHRPGLFDELLPKYGLPASWGAECAARFCAYSGAELVDSRSLSNELRMLQSRGCRLALVTNGRAPLQLHKLRLLGLEEMFDVCICCDPAKPAQLKPAVWAWNKLRGWRSGLPTGYVGDDPVDAQFALAGHARFIGFTFKNSRYDN